MLSALNKGIMTVKERLRTQGFRTTALWAYARGIPKVTGVPLLEYSRVTDSLYVGPQHRTNGKRTLQQAGITHIVNMRSEFDDAAHALTLEEGGASGYCHLPTADDDPISPEHLARGIAFIGGAINDGGKVYVHCTAGVGRAPSMAAAYLISAGYHMDEALSLIQEVRPFIRPTTTQLDALRQFERSVKGEPLAAG